MDSSNPMKQTNTTVCSDSRLRYSLTYTILTPLMEILYSYIDWCIWSNIAFNFIVLQQHYIFTWGYIPFTITNYSIAIGKKNKSRYPDKFFNAITASRLKGITLCYYHIISITARRGRDDSLWVLFFFTQAQTCKHVSSVLFASPVS